MSSVSTISLSELKENLALWKNTCESADSTRGDEVAKVGFERSPTTHTFSWTSKGIDLAERILFKDRALVSDAQRQKNSSESPQGLVAEVASKVGLNDFVFTYLGVHEPYYARQLFPAFGIFVNVKAESYPGCIATRRDLKSGDVKLDVENDPNPKQIMVQFLLPQDARTLALQELYLDRHRGSFRHYWGHPELWHGEYAEKHWQWVFEFHFKKTIPASAFHAILWPKGNKECRFRIGRIPLTYTVDPAIYVKQNPQCKIIFFDPALNRTPEKAFVSASAKALEYYLSHGDFPEEI
jgi:hypothetical protein